MKIKTYPYFYAGQKQDLFCSAKVVGNLLWLSGMSGRLPETGQISTPDPTGRLPETGQVGTPDPAQQTIDALSRIKHNLEEAGTSLENVIAWNFYVKDTNRDRDAIGLAFRDYIRKNAPTLAENIPANVWAGIRELYFPNMLIEIGDITAIIPNKEKIKTYPYFYAGQKQDLFCSAKVVGNLVWAAGMSGRLPETGQVGTPDPAQQTIDALNKIKHNLEEAGTSLENIVRMNVYVKDTNRDRDKIEGALRDYLRKNAPALLENPPAAVWIGVRELYFPNMLIEMGDVTAIIPKKEKIRTYPYFLAGQKQDLFCSAKVVGNLVWAAGMSGRLPETGQVGTPDPAQQTIDALNKIKHNLEEAGTSLENIVRMNVYVKDTNRDRDKIEGALRDYLRKNAPALLENPPASTWIGVDSLYYPDMLVEFEPLAVLSAKE